jgi:predicted nucleic acid-binding protein
MYADAGVFLLPVLHTDRVPSASAAARLLESLARGTREVSTSTLTWDEVVYVIRRILGPEDSISKGVELLDFPNLTWLRVDVIVLRRAEDLYRSLPMRPRDAIHAAAALEAGERQILSEDRVFDQVSDLRRIWPPPP